MKTADREYIKEAVRRGEIKEEDANLLIATLESATDKHCKLWMDGDRLLFKQCCAPGWDEPVKTIATDHT